MWRCLVCGLVLAMLSSPATSQTISVSVSDWLKVRSELLISKSLSARLGERTQSLVRDLAEARQSQETSRERISDLERQLADSVAEQGRLTSIIASLESQLAGLSESLTATQSQVDEAEKAHLRAIRDALRAHRVEVWAYRVALAAAVAGAIYAVAR